ncbi:MAG: SGNH/GDSL hydrolase family protein [Desulfobacteraceae bacterium]|jgi:hypothetical protein
MARLVAIGDSLTQGFQSLAISKTHLSYPAMIAECMGISVSEFRVPNFLGMGGFPLNIETLARKLEEKYGHNINMFEWPLAIDAVLDYIDDVEDYWERGKGSQVTQNTSFHNLAVWGFEVADAYNITAEYCSGKIKDPKDNWFQPPSEARLRTAYRVLNPAQLSTREQDSQVRIAQRISQEEGIDNLIVWLGANNCLGTVISLKVIETGPEPPGVKTDYTLWHPEAFRKEYEELANYINMINAQNVYVATVPHVTIPPITRGVMKDRGHLPRGDKYFDFYTHFYIQDKNFKESRDPHLTGEQAKQIDTYIDEYNNIIKRCAESNGWHVVDTCMVLDQLAVRRNYGKPGYSLDPAISDLSVRFFEIGQSGNLKNGGIISLDGVHPTTCGYGIVAQEFINVMKKQNPGIRDIDFEEVRYWDSLVTNPPKTLDDVFGMLKTLEKYFHISRLYK